MGNTLKDKQIEEMAITILDFVHTKHNQFSMQDLAEALYNAGYHKASEVARQIFEEIEKETKNHGICYTQRKIAELKKKYTESEDKE